MNYLRNFGNLKVGQRVLQIAFGSGFKCNSAVWLCINNGSRPGKRNHIDDRELEAEELEKQLDEFGYIKRQTNYSASTSRCGNFPRLEDKKLK